jgi:hypothetical protein
VPNRTALRDVAQVGEFRRAVARIRPEAERRLRAGFQRRVDEQRQRYAVQLAHAGQLAVRFECGEVAGVFSREAGIGRPALVAGLLPLAAVPVLIAGAAAQVPGMLPALGAFPFVFGAWYGVSLWRGLRRRVWCYAFAEGFMLLDDPAGAAVPVRWDQVIEVTPVWTEVYSPAAEESRPALAGYRLRTAAGQAHEISRSFKNVQDPYLEMGQLFRHLAPNTIGTTMPAFPTIDQIIAAYARKPARGP